MKKEKKQLTKEDLIKRYQSHIKSCQHKAELYQLEALMWKDKLKKLLGITRGGIR